MKAAGNCCRTSLLANVAPENDSKLWRILDMSWVSSSMRNLGLLRGFSRSMIEEKEQELREIDGAGCKRPADGGL